MSRTKEWYMQQQKNEPIDITQDEDYLCEQWLKEKQYWDEVNSGSIFPENWEYSDEYYKSAYLPTKEEEDENFKQTFNKDGNTA